MSLDRHQSHKKNYRSFTKTVTIMLGSGYTVSDRLLPDPADVGHRVGDENGHLGQNLIPCSVSQWARSPNPPVIV